MFSLVYHSHSLSYWSLEVVHGTNMVPHGKDLSEDLKKRRAALHKDVLDYKKNPHLETELQHGGQDHTVV